MLKQRRNARCTAVTDSVLMNSQTLKILRCILAILLSTDAIQGVPGGMCETSGECSLGQTIPI
jgi:hypothetical protein